MKLVKDKYLVVGADFAGYPLKEAVDNKYCVVVFVYNHHRNYTRPLLFPRLYLKWQARRNYLKYIRPRDPRFYNVLLKSLFLSSCPYLKINSFSPALNTTNAALITDNIVIAYAIK